MTRSEAKPARSRLASLGLYLLALVWIYVASSGPLTRWYPRVADRIYAPLTPLARSPIVGRPLRAWLRVWGVKDAPP